MQGGQLIAESGTSTPHSQQPRGRIFKVWVIAEAGGGGFETHGMEMSLTG
jgi:hypothetical protein